MNTTESLQKAKTATREAVAACSLAVAVAEGQKQHLLALNIAEEMEKIHKSAERLERLLAIVNEGGAS